MDGKARVLVDAGGGTFQRFGAAGAELGTLDAIALSHFHTDHSAELPAFVKGMFFMPRRDAPIKVSGPAAGGVFPGLREFAAGMFSEAGVYRYLGWALQPGTSSADLELLEVPLDRAVHSVLKSDDLEVEAVSVEHGPVPALAYRVRAGGRTFVFSGDQNGNNPHFIDFAGDADVLVMHHAIPEKADPVAALLHARPSEIARVALLSKARRLVLSHHMQRSLRQLDNATNSIANIYEGPIIVGQDSMCILID
jgi:ribonuclease BN (tRNA processing enzyme)